MPTRADAALRLYCDGANNSTSFPDDSLNGLTVTAVGNAKVSTAQSKWGGASLELDGTGDWLSIATTLVFGFGTGDWTAEAWVRPSALATPRTIFDFRSSNLTTDDGFSLQLSGSILYLRTDTGSVVGSAGPSSITIDAWNHVAWCYSGGVLRAFINGVWQYSVTTALSIGATRPLTIGARWDGAATFVGHIDDIRVTNGAWYPTADDFTAPAAPLDTLVVEAAIQVAGPLARPLLYGKALPPLLGDPFHDNVSLLLHCDGANLAITINDDSPFGEDVTGHSSANLDTSTKVFGTASLKCAPSSVGARGTFSSIDRYLFGTGDFTIEGRARFTNLASTPFLRFLISSSGSSVPWQVSIDYRGRIQFYRNNGSGAVLVLSADEDARIAVNTWAAWAVCRVDGVTRIFLDGVKVGEVADTHDYVVASGSTPTQIVVSNIEATITAYHDELRITKGVGRYTDDYPVPDEPFLGDAPDPIGIIAVAAPIGQPAFVAKTPNFGRPASLGPVTQFGTTTFSMLSYATGAQFSQNFGSAAYSDDRVTAASSIATSTAFGEAQAVRGIPLLPPGSAKWLTPTTTFGNPVAQAAANCQASGSVATAVPAPLARLLQAATGFTTGAFGSAASSFACVASGARNTAFGTPAVLSPRYAAGSQFGVFGTPAALAPIACSATGWLTTQIGSPSAADVFTRTRSAVFRPTFGRAQAERTAP